MMQGDLRHYQNIAQDIFDGKLPYRDIFIEYPPYAIIFFILPRLFGGYDAYPTIFMITILIGDWLIKASLLIIGLRNSKTLRGLLPVVFFALSVPAIRFFYLQRYDIWPALITVVAIWSFTCQRYVWAGIAIAFGVGLKLYPAVFIPALLIFAMRRKKEKGFLIGLFVGLLPIITVSIFLPWWRFAEIQGTRGLQVESLYASLLWMGHLCHLFQLQWSWTKAWLEIKGVSVSYVLPWARVIFFSMVMGCSGLSGYIAGRLPPLLLNEKNRVSVAKLSRLLLIPMVAFVIFNMVLSPQYLIWLLPLAAIASLEGSIWSVILIPLAMLLTPIFFPTNDYLTGLNLSETAILLLRNVMLIVSLILLLYEWYCILRIRKFTK